MLASFPASNFLVTEVSSQDPWLVLSPPCLLSFFFPIPLLFSFHGVFSVLKYLPCPSCVIPIVW